MNKKNPNGLYLVDNDVVLDTDEWASLSDDLNRKFTDLYCSAMNVTMSFTMLCNSLQRNLPLGYSNYDIYALKLRRARKAYLRSKRNQEYPLKMKKCKHGRTYRVRRRK